MLNYLKLIKILISLQTIFISSMIPVFFNATFTNKLKLDIDTPITWQIPILILITLIFESKIVYKAFTIYLLLGLFFLPIFSQGGSLGYLLTPNFGYLIGIYPLINIINKLNNKTKIYFFDFFKNSILAILAMHITGIIYNLIQIIYYKNLDIFIYNFGKYSLGKIGYHFLVLIPLSIVVKYIKYIKK